jgi:hypothetical protein
MAIQQREIFSCMETHKQKPQIEEKRRTSQRSSQRTMKTLALMIAHSKFKNQERAQLG